MAGPPCETWSIARFREPVQGARGPRARPPRPLRLASQLWGLPFVSERESDQLSLGNRLLRTTLEFAVVCWRLLIPEVVEHPAEPWSPPEAPSSWHLELTKDLLQQPGVEKHTIHQCAFGAPSRKPTCLM
eukprot:9478744-Pyramimonas_sp.AAC.1